VDAILKKQITPIKNSANLLNNEVFLFIQKLSDSQGA